LCPESPAHFEDQSQQDLTPAPRIFMTTSEPVSTLRRAASASRARPRPPLTDSRRLVAGAAAVAGALAIAGLANHLSARRAERRNPPRGRFVTIHGVRLHYVDVGEGPALLLLHGNGSMIQDLASSGLLDHAARRYRVIAFDRPGFGHSTRPRDRVWSAEAQADLFRAALAHLGVSRALVLGHSWGASVAVAMALRHPQSVSGLVLVSGYYFPTKRLDMVLLSGPALPVLGDLARQTVAPILTRLLWPLLLRKIFGPAPVPPEFRDFPKEMAVRPSQLRAAAAESALLMPAAAAAADRYAEFEMPVAIVAGAGDRLIDPDVQSGRLHRKIAGSRLRMVPGAGHMVHQTDPTAVLKAIDEVAQMASMARAAS
jgi:pimeloyl-ACP methyl ester carboxylesterase